MQIIEYPLLPPGKCVECGYGGRGRRYIDTRLDLEFYGVVYVCELCLSNWASNFGLGPVSMLQESVDRLSARVRELENERYILLGTLRTLELSSVATTGQPTLFDSDDSEVEQGQGPSNPKSSELSLK